MSKRYGKWEVIKSIGQGGQGHVFLVRDMNAGPDDRHVLKRLINTGDQARKERFKREVDVTQQLRHPNILKIVDENLGAQEPYYVAEYCEKGSIDKFKGKEAFSGNISTCLKVIFPVVEALRSAHQAGVIHRDVKPANILLRGDGTPVIGDFGICFVESGQWVTLSDEAMGSKNFIAPEMESGVHDSPTERTDVYSLGKVLYWMLSGGRVFAREDHRRNSLTSILDDQRFEHVHMLLDRMIVEEPTKRVSSTDLKEELLMVESLVSGNYAPLKPSMGIKCRFCGKGIYKKYATSLDLENPTRRKPLTMANELGWEPRGMSDVRVLRCDYCGHVETFQFDGIRDHDWWGK